MMSSLRNPNDAASPVPFVEDPSPYDGWTWQYFNLDNGQAFTLASFVEGEMDYNLFVPYGYFVNPKDGAWETTYFYGSNTLFSPVQFPTLTGKSRYKTPRVDVPMVRVYKDLKNDLIPALLPLSGVATPWCESGTFNGADWGLIAEFAVDYTDMSGNYADGVGFMETVGFEKAEDYRKFALEFLRRGVKPSNTPAWKRYQR